LSASNPLVTAVLPVYNRAWCIRRSVESVLGQTYRPLELIVVDDGSADTTSDILRDIAQSHGANEKAAAADISLTIFRQENQGVSAARNAGIRRARGELIAFLDSDDVWLPEKTSRQVADLLGHPRLMLSQTDEQWVRRGVRVNPTARHRKRAGNLFKQSLELCMISPSAVIIRKGIFDRVGLFDESFPACEDYEMWLRITCRYEVGLLPEPLVVKYGGHADQLSATVEALDRYRIRAITKLMDSGLLSPTQYALAVAALKEKCRVYGQGCLKRGREEEARQALALAEEYRTQGTARGPTL